MRNDELRARRLRPDSPATPAARTRPALLALALAAAGAACAEPAGKPVATLRRPIVNGTPAPTAIALDAGQQLAAGWLHYPGAADDPYCSAALVAPRVVATASHCVFGASANSIAFSVGERVTAPAATFAIEANFDHPYVDAALLRLSEDATVRLPQVRPVPAATTIPESIVGTQGEAAGFGSGSGSGRGPRERRFVALEVVELDEESIYVDGHGERGICFGDSGGPLFGLDPADGTARVLAVESTGDDSCVDRDELTRLDVLADWVATVVAGGAPTFPDGCDGVDWLGRCTGSVAEWCDRGRLETRDCADEGEQCGWVDGNTGYFCTEEPSEPCGRETFIGHCEGAVLVWCARGALSRADCAADGEACGYVDDDTGYNCVAAGGATTPPDGTDEGGTVTPGGGAVEPGGGGDVGGEGTDGGALVGGGTGDGTDGDGREDAGGDGFLGCSASGAPAAGDCAAAGGLAAALGIGRRRARRRVASCPSP